MTYQALNYQQNNDQADHMKQVEKSVRKIKIATLIAIPAMVVGMILILTIVAYVVLDGAFALAGWIL